MLELPKLSGVETSVCSIVFANDGSMNNKYEAKTVMNVRSDPVVIKYCRYKRCFSCGLSELVLEWNIEDDEDDEAVQDIINIDDKK